MTSTVDVDRNVETARRLTLQAAADGASLIVLPEAFAFLGPEQGKLEVAEPLPEGGPILGHFASLARETGADLILGGFWERGTTGARVRASSVHLDPEGAVRSVYRKIHLFDVDLPDGTSIRESDTLEPGDEVVVADTAVGRVGLSICYDLRFPELYRKLVDAGSTLLTVPAAFTATTGKDHWHVLLRARAIEAQCYVVAAAQTGLHFGQRRSYGHALICDPWGNVLSDCGEAEGYALGSVDMAELQGIRAGLPSLAHRRL